MLLLDELARRHVQHQGPVKSGNRCEVEIREQLCTVEAGRALSCLVSLVAATPGGAVCACFVRQVGIRNDGSATSLIGTVQTLGVDQKDGDASAWTVDLAADDGHSACIGYFRRDYLFCRIYGPVIGYVTGVPCAVFCLQYKMICDGRPQSGWATGYRCT